MELNLTGGSEESLHNPGSRREEKVTVLGNTLHQSPSL